MRLDLWQSIIHRLGKGPGSELGSLVGECQEAVQFGLTFGQTQAAFLLSGSEVLNGHQLSLGCGTC